jgi:hypothetical protein
MMIRLKINYNMRKIFLLLVLTLSVCLLHGQNENRLKEIRELSKSKDTTKWLSGAGIGLDFGQLLQINPAVGAGENKIGFGGVASFYANYKDGKLAWDNVIDLLLGVQKLGGGYSTLNPNLRTPWQKSIDELRVGSKIGFKASSNSKFFYSLLFTFQSQLLNTYSDTSLINPIKGNYLKDVSGKGQGPIAQFLSPARITISPGIDYKANKNLSVFISPASLKMIVVANDDIAAIPARKASGETLGVGIHGNPWRSGTDYDKTLTQLGATLAAVYTNKFLKDRISFKSGLTLFSNYLKEPGNVDVDWNTETAFMIWKGISVTLNTRLFYDHDIPVQITDNDAVGGVNGIGRRASFTEQLYIKYNYVF